MIIVERSEAELFEYLSCRFEQIPDVRIILDRRRTRMREVEWHAANRRDRSDSDEHLRSHGYVIIHERPCAGQAGEAGHGEIEG